MWATIPNRPASHREREHVTHTQKLLHFQNVPTWWQHCIKETWDTFIYNPTYWEFFPDKNLLKVQYVTFTLSLSVYIYSKYVKKNKKQKINKIIIIYLFFTYLWTRHGVAFFLKCFSPRFSFINPSTEDWSRSHWWYSESINFNGGLKTFINVMFLQIACEINLEMWERSHKMTCFLFVICCFLIFVIFCFPYMNHWTPAGGQVWKQLEPTNPITA